MTSVLREILDFNQLLKTFISDLLVKCKSQNDIQECSYVVLKDFWKIEVESKCCQKMKIIITAVFRVISDSDQFFITLNSEL